MILFLLKNKNCGICRDIWLFNAFINKCIWNLHSELRRLLVEDIKIHTFCMQTMPCCWLRTQMICSATMNMDMNINVSKIMIAVLDRELE